MKIITNYILKRFLRNFFIVLVGLELFFVGIDLISNAASLPESANLKLLYIVFVTVFALTMTLPLALVFGWMISIVSLIKSNELVACIALGAKAKDILFGPMIATLLILTILILIQSTPMAYSAEYKSKILNNQYFVSQKNNLFFKFDNYFVHFETLLPAQKEAEKITIFQIENDDVVLQIKANKGHFEDNRWIFSDAQILEKPIDINWEKSKLKFYTQTKIVLLEGFKPKILDTVYEPKGGYSIKDGLDSFILLDSQNINTTKIRASLYNQILIPFFIIPIMFIIYFYANINNRFFKANEFASIIIFVTLILWGSFFLLFKLSANNVLLPEMALLVPLGILAIVSYFMILHRGKTI